MGSPVQDQRAERRDVAKFLAKHEECDSDFEIRRVAGRGKGRLRLICNGCGERAAYDASEPGVLEQIDKPEVDSSRRRKVSREGLERWLPAPPALPWWIPNAYIVGVIAIGLGLIAFGLSSQGGDEPMFMGGNDSRETTVPPQPAPAQAPATTGASAAGSPEPRDDGDGGKDEEEKDGKGGEQRSPELDTVTVLGRFAIGVPSGWLRGMSGGAVVFTTPGREAILRVFLEPGDEAPQRLSHDAAEFLEREHPSAKISRPTRFRLGDDPAVRLVASYDGGTERAALLTESGYSYLLLSKVEKGAPEPIRSGAMAAMYSFNAL